MNRPKRKVLIVGAGLAGLSMYLALDKQKFDIEIFEKKSKFKRLGYALIFMPLGSIALKQLRFTTRDIKKLGAHISRNIVRNLDGSIKQVVDYKKINKRFGNYMIITRQRLYDLLEKRVPTEVIKFGKNIGSMENLKKKYDLVIGADGIHSQIREIVFQHTKLNDLKQTLIWMWIPRRSGAYPKHGGLGGVPGVGFFNSGEKDKSCVVFFVGSDTSFIKASPKNYPELLKKMFRNFKGPLPRILKYLPPGREMYLQRDYEVDIGNWYKGNIVLIGDAAHARSAFSGAGSSLAIEDSVILGKLLNSNIKTGEALREYQKIQRDRVRKMAMRNVSLYFQDQTGIEKYLSDFISSSRLYKKHVK